jgi:hypothetical protein
MSAGSPCRHQGAAVHRAADWRPVALTDRADLAARLRPKTPEQLELFAASAR